MRITPRVCTSVLSLYIEITLPLDDNLYRIECKIVPDGGGLGYSISYLSSSVALYTFNILPAHVDTMGIFWWTLRVTLSTSTSVLSWQSLPVITSDLRALHSN